MTDQDRSVTVANDLTLSAMINGARRRVVLVAPAVSRLVAEALVGCWQSLAPSDVSVVLDMDPEVYRLGYGDPEALTLLEVAARRLGRALNRHRGIRIGLLIVDDSTLVYAPTPLLVEAGPRQADTPNAVLLGALPGAVSRDLGLGPDGLRHQTVGLDRVEPGQVDQVRADLTQNPPRKFDIARTERVFNAFFEFVDFELIGAAVHRREVSIPSWLVRLGAGEETEKLLKTSFRLVDADDDLSGTDLLDYKARIAAAFLRPIKGYGSTILRKHKAEFETEVEGLRQAIEAFRMTVREDLQATIDRNRESLKQGLLSRLISDPPKRWRRPDGTPPNKEMTERLLDRDLRRAFGTAERYLGEMTVKVVFKGVTYESLKDPKFMELAREAIPELETLYHEYEAARGAANEKPSD
jgi:hypothetical protein